MSEQNNKLTPHDAFIALFYIIIICIGINHCITRGVSPSPMQLYAISLCLAGIVLFKILKYAKNLRNHIKELIFPAILFIASLVPAVSMLLF